MRRKTILALIPFLLAGCLSPLTQRLDETNARAAALQQQLEVANQKLDDAARTLERSEAKFDEANKTLNHMDGTLADIDKKFTTIELGFRKLLGIKGPEEE